MFVPAALELSIYGSVNVDEYFKVYVIARGTRRSDS